MAGSDLTLHGFAPSVYTRVIRLVLAEKKLNYRFNEVDPFDTAQGAACRALHPFGQVPCLSDDGFLVYETVAIARYLDAVFSEPSLTPDAPRAQARMAQVCGIIDAHGYWPLVRQVFAQRVFGPSEGRQADAAEIAAGLRAAPMVLSALEAIAAEGLVLRGLDPSLADCHLGPMIAAFTAAPEGAEMVMQYPALSSWWSTWRVRPSMRQTDTGFDRIPTA